MSEKLSSIAGKESDFITRFIGGGVTTAVGGGGTPNILTITPPPGQRIRLTHLSTGAGDYRRLIDLFFGATEVISGGVISGENPDDTYVWGLGFSIGSYQPYAAGEPPFGNRGYFTGDTDEALIIDSGDSISATAVYYGYQFGE